MDVHKDREVVKCPKCNEDAYVGRVTNGVVCDTCHDVHFTKEHPLRKRGQRS